MSDRRSVPAWVVVLALAVAALGAAAAVWAFFRWLRPDLVAVPSVDLDRLSGSWRSIAALSVAERDTGPGMALRIHHEGSGALRISRLGRTTADQKRGKKRTDREVLAMATERGTRLSLSHGGGLGRQLTVLALTPSYDAVLIGSPDRRRAWMLSRDGTLARPTWRYFRDELARQGFPVHRLRQVPGTRVQLDEADALPIVEHVPPASEDGPPAAADEPSAAEDRG